MLSRLSWKIIWVAAKAKNYPNGLCRPRCPYRASLERGKVVDAIVSSAYPTDKMQAIINNHFANLAKIADGKKLDADDKEHEAEYEAMQSWRTKAKAVATDVIDNYISTH